MEKQMENEMEAGILLGIIGEYFQRLWLLIGVYVEFGGWDFQVKREKLNLSKNRVRSKPQRPNQTWQRPGLGLRE